MSPRRQEGARGGSQTLLQTRGESELQTRGCTQHRTRGRAGGGPRHTRRLPHAADARSRPWGPGRDAASSCPGAQPRAGPGEHGGGGLALAGTPKAPPNCCLPSWDSHRRPGTLGWRGGQGPHSGPYGLATVAVPCSPPRQEAGGEVSGSAGRRDGRA